MRKLPPSFRRQIFFSTPSPHPAGRSRHAWILRRLLNSRRRRPRRPSPRPSGTRRGRSCPRPPTAPPATGVLAPRGASGSRTTRPRTRSTAGRAGPRASPSATTSSSGPAWARTSCTTASSRPRTWVLCGTAHGMLTCSQGGHITVRKRSDPTCPPFTSTH
jgi:hypothetical protein